MVYTRFQIPCIDQDRSCRVPHSRIRNLWASVHLATIGTGDVLAGLVAALWAQGLDGETAARSGVFWHGVAGSQLASLRTVTAEELVYAVGELL